MASQLMGLSLFIMMLAFFIVLNAISSFEEQKVQPVMKSVSGTFGGLEDVDIIAVPVPMDSGKEEGEGSALEQIEALFKTNIAGIDAEIDEASGTMHIQVPFEKFYALATQKQPTSENKEENNTAEQKLFTVSLGSLMKIREFGSTYRVDFLVGIGENPAKVKVESPNMVHNLSNRLSKMAKSLNNAGIENSAISVGMHRGTADMLDIYFRPANYM